MNLQQRIRMDIMAYTGCSWENSIMLKYRRMALRHAGFRYIYYWRLSKSRGIRAFIAKLRKKSLSKRYGIEIGTSVDIGGGFKIIHPWGITFNSKVTIGNNVTVLKGVTIGNQKRGKYEGSPRIGNNVYIGLNATIVGGIQIGDNVLIAPNSFVNRPIEDNSVVIGNPFSRHFSINATKNYLPILEYNDDINEI